MTQKANENFIEEIYFKPLKKKFITIKTDVYHIDGIWSLEFLDLEDYVPESNRGYKYVLVVIDKFINFGWTVSLKNKKAHAITNSIENIFITFKRKPIKSNLLEERIFRGLFCKIF